MVRWRERWNLLIYFSLYIAQAEVVEHKRFAQGLDLKGRIYISWQGINAQFSGTKEDAHAYTEWVTSRPGFSGLEWRSEVSARCAKWEVTSHAPIPRPFPMP